MNYRMVMNLCGKIMLVNAAILMIPLAVSFIYSDGQALPFIYGNL